MYQRQVPLRLVRAAQHCLFIVEAARVCVVVITRSPYICLQTRQLYVIWSIMNLEWSRSAQIVWKQPHSVWFRAHHAHAHVNVLVDMSHTYTELLPHLSTGLITCCHYMHRLLHAVHYMTHYMEHLLPTSHHHYMHVMAPLHACNGRM